MIDRMQNVEVNEEQIAPYMGQIMKQMEDLPKEEMIKRFVSLEFNRFLDYYKNASDLNIPEHSTRDRDGRSDHEGRGERNGNEGGNRRRKTGERVRLKINLGAKEGMNPKRILGIINDVTEDKSINIGDIEITNKFTFFDVFEDQKDKVLNSFRHAEDMEVSVAKGSKSGGDYSDRGKRDYSSKERKSSGASNYRNEEKPWRNRDTKSSGNDKKKRWKTA